MNYFFSSFSLSLLLTVVNDLVQSLQLGCSGCGLVVRLLPVSLMFDSAECLDTDVSSHVAVLCHRDRGENLRTANILDNVLFCFVAPGT